MTTDMRELNTNELEHVSGGVWSGGNWKECTIGTPNGGGPGVYPWYVTCASTTWGELFQRIQDTVNNGGRPA
jgi:bacteriocin-like protein